MESLQLALASKGVRSAEFLILVNAANQIIASVFGVAREKLENRWRERGGLQGYSHHVQEVAKKFDRIMGNNCDGYADQRYAVSY